MLQPLIFFFFYKNLVSILKDIINKELSHVPFDSPPQLDKQNLIYTQANYNGQVMINWLSRDLRSKWDFFI